MSKKILLADDSLTIQKVAELTFADTDYELVCVSNGQQALEKIAGDKPDLVFADVVMPAKNGYEVCEAVKSNPTTARIPVVLLTGVFEPFDRERAERIGCDAIVSKPFDSSKLLAEVEEILARPAAPPAEPVETREPEPFETPAPPPGEPPQYAQETIEISAEEAEVLFDVEPEGEPPPVFQEPPPPPEARAEPPTEAPLAAPDGALTDEQIEMVARRVVERLSERVVREIAWEVVPDMAEIVIKRRIKELESGVE